VPKITKIMFVLTAVLLTMSAAATSFADSDLSNVPPHRHWIRNGQGLVQVGPRVCDDANLQGAFNQFHNNLHVAGATSTGPVAPGLHNFKGAEITASPCSVLLG
jgi:hypothetical protein